VVGLLKLQQPRLPLLRPAQMIILTETVTTGQERTTAMNNMCHLWQATAKSPVDSVVDQLRQQQPQQPPQPQQPQQLLRAQMRILTETVTTGQEKTTAMNDMCHICPETARNPVDCVSL